MARPTKYKTEYNDLVRKLSEFRLIDTEIAKCLNVSEVTLNAWKKSHPEFLKSLKDGKDISDSRVVRSLYERAVGYSHPEDKIFNDNGKALVVGTTKHYPPDPTSCIYWLNNRQPEDWRNKNETDINVKSWPEKVKVEIVEADGS